MGLGLGSGVAAGASGNLGLLGTAARKRAAGPEVKAEAKKKYEEIFSDKQTYEVRLVNKSLAMRKGFFMGMAQENKLAVFESSRQIVAVPADKLNKKLAEKCADRIEKAVQVLTETGVAFEDVLEIPEEGEEKKVGLTGREKIKMFIHRKPKGKKKKSAKKTKSARNDKKAEKADSKG